MPKFPNLNFFPYYSSIPLFLYIFDLMFYHLGLFTPLQINLIHTS